MKAATVQQLLLFHAYICTKTFHSETALIRGSLRIALGLPGALAALFLCPVLLHTIQHRSLVQFDSFTNVIGGHIRFQMQIHAGHDSAAQFKGEDY